MLSIEKYCYIDRAFFHENFELKILKIRFNLPELWALVYWPQSLRFSAPSVKFYNLIYFSCIHKWSKNLVLNFQWNWLKSEFYRALRSFQRRRRWRLNRCDLGLATWGARFYFYRPTLIINKIAFYSEYERKDNSHPTILHDLT